MKRDISFRAWDGEIMLFYEPQTTEEYCIEWIDFFFKKCDVMQFTGLYDRNYNPIFEGDILKIPEIYDRGDGLFDDGLCEVKWDECFFIATDNKGYVQFLHIENNIEVVGNIYENSELLDAAS